MVPDFSVRLIMPSPDSPYSGEKLLCSTLNSSTASGETPLFHCMLGDTREIETPSTSTSVPPSWPPFTLKSSVALSAGLLPTTPTNPGTSVMNWTGLRIVPVTSSGRFAIKLLSTVTPISEVAVSSWLASALTVMVSVTEPICISISSDTVLPVCTVTPSRSYFFMPVASTFTE